jgi:hypothetical protein
MVAKLGFSRFFDGLARKIGDRRRQIALREPGRILEPLVRPEGPAGGIWQTSRHRELVKFAAERNCAFPGHLPAAKNQNCRGFSFGRDRAGVPGSSEPDY